MRAPGTESAEMLGGAVNAELLLARSRDTALLVRHVSATPRGISFVLDIRLGEPMSAAADDQSGLDPLWQEIERLLSAPDGWADDDLQFRVEFPNGAQFRPPEGRSRPAEEIVLISLGSGGNAEHFRVEYWLGALPPADGEVQFVCSWVRRGIPESRAQVPASAINTAAERATPLFS